MQKDFKTTFSNTNPDSWKIRRDFQEKRIPAVIDLNDVTIDIILLIILVALIALLPGLKNKMIKQWIKIFVCLTVLAVAISALTQKNWLRGNVHSLISVDNLLEKEFFRHLKLTKNGKLLNFSTSSFPNKTSMLQTSIKLKIGLKTINVTLELKENDKHASHVNFLQFKSNRTTAGAKSNWTHRRRPGSNEIKIAQAFNIQIQLEDLDSCKNSFKRALETGWPTSLLQAMEYLTNGYHELYFSGPEFSWCSNFRRAGYLTYKLIAISIAVIGFTWILYLKSMMAEAAIGTISLGILLISADITYVLMIGQVARLPNYHYKFSEISFEYATLPRHSIISKINHQIDSNNGLDNLYSGLLIHEILNTLIFPTKTILLALDWSFWSVLGTGIVCIAIGISIYTANIFYPLHTPLNVIKDNTPTEAGKKVVESMAHNESKIVCDEKGFCVRIPKEIPGEKMENISLSFQEISGIGESLADSLTETVHQKSQSLSNLEDDRLESVQTLAAVPQLLLNDNPLVLSDMAHRRPIKTATKSESKAKAVKSFCNNSTPVKSPVKSYSFTSPNTKVGTQVNSNQRPGEYKSCYRITRENDPDKQAIGRRKDVDRNPTKMFIGIKGGNMMTSTPKPSNRRSQSFTSIHVPDIVK